MKHIYIFFVIISQLCFSQINLVKDIRSGTTSSLLSGFVEYQGQLYFKATDGVNGSELWKSDGTNSGTVLVADSNPGSSSFNPSNLTIFNGKLYFSALTALNGSEIYSYDGSVISIAADIKPGSASSSPGFIVSFNGNLYFRAQEATSTLYRLYKLTPSNTYSVLDNTNLVGTSAAVLGAQLLFSGGNIAGNTQLYRTDGTTISLVKTINPTGSATVSNLYTAPTLNKTFFEATNGTDGKEVWVTDGTTAGTMMVADINPTGDSNPSDFYEHNGKVYFQAAASTGNIELWSTDGVTKTLVKDINPTGNSLPSNFLTFNNFLYFSANDGTSGSELWRTDGTAANTTLFLDINPGVGNASPSDQISFNGSIYLAADNGTTGKELYTISGSTLGVKNIPKEKLTIFPNPSNGTINLNRKISGSYQIYSYAAALIKSGVLRNSTTLSLQLPAGSYLMLLESEGLKTTFPIIIKK
ncbi:ELWxxDGT repeat protein [Chryseobacterium sp. MP_3.2]|uniref:ELWxxDGT repeat protein n=1 Tax=Chryseobacterium sp. MP_3.2 TaxID=3071712 RepID=UPI002E0547A1|nr:ELWxxDGT repeat protein [Chryseobacterium sp. MP_3.2]